MMVAAVTAPDCVVIGTDMFMVTIAAVAPVIAACTAAEHRQEHGGRRRRSGRAKPRHLGELANQVAQVDENTPHADREEGS